MRIIKLPIAKPRDVHISKCRFKALVLESVSLKIKLNNSFCNIERCRILQSTAFLFPKRHRKSKIDLIIPNIFFFPKIIKRREILFLSKIIWNQTERGFKELHSRSQVKNRSYFITKQDKLHYKIQVGSIFWEGHGDQLT